MRNIILAFALLLALPAHANICGTDYQNFNPTTNGIDFVTVQSSQTIAPCIINLGLFLNYAANSLTFTSGQKQRDRILASDLSFGMGINKKWDFGVNLPSVVSQTVDDPNNGSTFAQTGFTEIKANTKYQFSGDENHGLAGIFSINQNLIKDDPFTGSNSGPTLNFELAADKAINTVWAAAVNVGYRKRSPGDQIAGVPFVPLKDQWIYSVAASYLFEKYDTKLIFELYGSQIAQKINQATDRSMNSLEALLGVKHDFNHNLAAHIGFTSQVDTSLGGPDWRVYAGVNYSMGPICKTTKEQPLDRPEQRQGTEVYQLDVSVLFANDSDKMEPDAVEPLNEFFAIIVKKGFTKIEVSGHTDSVGSRDYNIDLSQRRAANVRSYLIKKFNLDDKKIESVGYGPDYPIANNGNYQGRHKNRRVEFKVWK